MATLTCDECGWSEETTAQEAAAQRAQHRREYHRTLGSVDFTYEETQKKSSKGEKSEDK